MNEHLRQAAARIVDEVDRASAIAPAGTPEYDLYQGAALRKNWTAIKTLLLSISEAPSADS